MMNQTLLTVAMLLAMSSMLCFPRSAPAEDIRAFLIGNSLTRTTFDKEKYVGKEEQTDKFRQLIADRGHTFEYLRHASAGAPLYRLYLGTQPGDTGFKKFYTEHLTAPGRYNVLTLQPYTGPLFGTLPWRPDGEKDGDVHACTGFINLAVQGNPDIQVYVLSHWPLLERTERTRKALIEKFDTFNFQARWDHQPTDRKTLESVHGHEARFRAYFEALVDQLNTDLHATGTLKKPVRMIPVGDVMYALDGKLRAAAAAGSPLTARTDVDADGKLDEVTVDQIAWAYGDQTHLAPGLGRYIQAMTWYAVLFKESPIGLGLAGSAPNADSFNDPKTYHDLYHYQFTEITPAMQKLIQETAWDVVREHRYAGVAQPQDAGDGQ